MKQKNLNGRGCRHRPACSTRKTLSGWLFLTLIHVGVASAQVPRVFYYYSDVLTRNEGVQEITGSVSAEHPLCRRVALRGLDLALQAVGLDSCDATPASRRSLVDRLDLIILIEDTFHIPSGVVGEIPPRLKRGSGSGSRVLVGVSYGRTPNLQHVERTLIVGSAEYGDATTDRAWMNRIRSVVEDMDTGGSYRDHIETLRMDVAFDSDFNEFQAAIEDRLCPIMKCGSDGRAHMRELIDRWPDLKGIHNSYSGDVNDGQQVSILAILYRQEDREERIWDLSFIFASEEINMPDEQVEGRRPSTEGLIEYIETYMLESAGPLPPTSYGESLDAVSTPYMAYLDGYAVTMRWLTNLSSSMNPVDGQLLPRNRPSHKRGCGASPRYTRNIAGCDAALTYWEEMDVSDRRLIRIPEARVQMLNSLAITYCGQFALICSPDRCACDRPQWAH